MHGRSSLQREHSARAVNWAVDIYLCGECSPRTYNEYSVRNTKVSDAQDYVGASLGCTKAGAQHSRRRFSRAKYHSASESKDRSDYMLIHIRPFISEHSGIV